MINSPPVLAARMRDAIYLGVAVPFGDHVSKTERSSVYDHYDATPRSPSLTPRAGESFCHFLGRVKDPGVQYQQRQSDAPMRGSPNSCSIRNSSGASIESRVTS
jgi:hypothetical protein